jgi:hypothetical protein
VKLIDPVVDVWKIYNMKNSPGEILRQYSCNIHVADRDGNNLSGATVTCTDKDGNTVFSIQTDENGDIEERIITYQRWSDPDGNYGTYAYEDDAECFSPHKLIISKSGYETLKLDNITVNEPIKWNLELQDPIPIVDYPSEDDVEEGVVFDSGNKTGNFAVPSESEVKKDVGYGSQSTEFTGTMESGMILVGNNLSAYLQRNVNLSATLQRRANLKGVLKKKTGLIGTLQLKLDITGILHKKTGLVGEIKK